MLELVKTAAETGCSASHTSSPTSGSPLGFSPAATPAARKPCGQARVGGQLAHVPGALHPARSEHAHEQPPRLRQAEHQVEVLQRLRGGALPEVVDGREGQHLAGVLVVGDEQAAVVGLAHLEHARGPVHDLHERLLGVGLGEQRADLRAVDGTGRGDVAADQLALVERHQVGLELHALLARAGELELLLDLGRVAVGGDLVGDQALGARRRVVRTNHFMPCSTS